MLGSRVFMSARNLFRSNTVTFDSYQFQGKLQRLQRRLLPMLGWPGIVAIGILVICPTFYFSTIRPMQDRLSVSLRMESSLRERTMNDGTAYSSALTPSEELDIFYKYFPSEKNSPHLLGKLVDVAKNNGLSLNHGEYIVTRDKVGQLIRFRITLPVQGKYKQIRKFLGSLNSEIPNMALENVQFERKDVLDTDVQVKISLLLYMVQAS